MTLTIPEDVLFRELDGESVLLHIGSGRYFGLDEVGTLIWKLLAEGREIDQIEQRIVEIYDVGPETVTRDVRRILDELCDRDLLETREESPR